MLAFLKLIRFPNLLIMAFTQYMIRWCVLAPLLELKRTDLDFSLLEMQMTEIDFFLLVLSTVLIGAAGYIINDYFDVRIDEVNRPSTNMIGKMVRRRVAMATHMTLNILGAGIGIWLSWKYNLFRVGSFLYVIAPALLWFYSTNLKRLFLAGNLVIAFLSGLVPLVVVLFEIPNIYHQWPELVQGGLLSLTDALHITLIVSAFAFMISLLREIIKDTEDYEGDLAYGCKTMPIVLGIAPVKWVMATLAASVMVALGWLQYGMIGAEDWLSFGYFSLLLQFPLAYLIYRILGAKGKSDWRFCSLLVKIIMVTGISYLFIFANMIYSAIGT
jgi:4-hydroxybenzoate polyprenyltransferase